MFILKETRHCYLHKRVIILLEMSEIVRLFVREAIKLHFVKLFSFRGVMVISKSSFSFLRDVFLPDAVFCHTIIIIDFLIVLLILS